VRLLRTALVLLAACGPPPAPPAAPLEADDFLLGGLPADVDTAELRLSFGAPDSIIRGDNPFAADVPLETWHYAAFEVRFSGATPVGYLLHGRGEETARGLRVGDPVSELRRRYGEPSARVDENWSYIGDAADDGFRILDFEVAADTIRRIYIGRAL
jgi:hypothetical protein